MELVNVNVDVAKETWELGQAMQAVVVAAKQALADGWQPGQDIPTVMMAIAGQLLPAIQGVEKIGDELKEDPAAFAKALALSMAGMADAFKKA